ncbi:MAG: GntR family transcriptional regulator [Pseudomonadota bacterium]|nr:GntR family transcriptional regulator [Pseudomonadota bacterium]MBU2252628.1 GntR family transcriptional regulator [Pseudomonadota bacterium]MBU3932643.1 GntR family transcriptional regulator [Pseudomonadota bacterium]MBU4120207.1 GntR family transcriptional regulator [Pseudomonadota bacterium]
MNNNPSVKQRKNGISVREKTYDYLKSNILSGRFVPGERLAEEHLAKELGVSRTPVREALHKLEQDGLIEPLESRGFCIPKDSEEEIEDLFELRTVLEGYTLKLICERITDEQIGRLEEIIDKAEVSLRRKRIDEVFQWNTEFHDILYGMVADKRRFYNLIVNIRKYVLRYRKDTLQYLGAAKRTIDGHRQILLALKLKDPDLCERVMRAHIREAKDDALQTNIEAR